MILYPPHFKKWGGFDPPVPPQWRPWTDGCLILSDTWCSIRPFVGRAICVHCFLPAVVIKVVTIHAKILVALVQRYYSINSAWLVSVSVYFISAVNAASEPRCPLYTFELFVHTFSFSSLGTTARWLTYKPTFSCSSLGTTARWLSYKPTSYLSWLILGYDT